MPDNFDLIGLWTEVKLDVLREYDQPYSQIINKYDLHPVYIDAFAGKGKHISETTGEPVIGSPLNALRTTPPFREYHFIDKNPARAKELRNYAHSDLRVFVHEGDCNEILLADVFPRVRYEERRRGLCFLDPYNIDLSWQVVAEAGRMRSIELFINFMVMDMNMNVLLRDPEKAAGTQIARMNRFWGDDSWRRTAYAEDPQGDLFEPTREIKVNEANEKIAEAYRKRLLDKAGFKFAPRPLRFVNNGGVTIYYLFFASHNPTGGKIVGQIFDKYRRKRELR